MTDDDDVTRIKPVADIPAPSAPLPVDPLPGAPATGASPTGAPATGSNWTHPEQWASEDRGPVGIGTVVRGRFQLESVLGEGGMGIVYRALDQLHLEMHDRDPYVAIKILSEDFKRHPQALIALQREARKAQSLAHENIITVHNFDRDGSVVYMTMELLDGKTLRTIVSENAMMGLPSDEVVPMIRGMAKALAYAHDNDIVHSDFKPGNVFLTRKGLIKVLDFGVARAASVNLEADGDRTVFDVTELGALTPAYASLEMLDGQDPVAADDVFALAIVAYELLTGRHPFDQGAVDETHLRRARAKALPGLNGAQRNALRRAFAPDRESRQQNAAEFLAEFDGTSPAKRLAQVGLGAAAALGLVAVIVSMGTDAPLTAVPFEELPPEVQAQFEAAVREGNMALGFGDAGINEALYYFSEAYELHPGNERAVLGLEESADWFLTSMRDADEDTQRNVFTLLYCQDYLSGYPPVASNCEELLDARQCASISQSCRAFDGD